MQVVIMTQRFKENMCISEVMATLATKIAQFLNYLEEIHQTKCCCLQGLKFIQFLVFVNKGDSPGVECLIFTLF